MLHDVHANSNLNVRTGTEMQKSAFLSVEYSAPLHGEVILEGAKNSALVAIASLLLIDGISILRRVPISADVFFMLKIMESLGAKVLFDQDSRVLTIDTRSINSCSLDRSIMGKFRASTLVLGPLLARFGKVIIAFPGGDAIGKRPIDFHIQAFEKMGARVTVTSETIEAHAMEGLQARELILTYPSVGATENILMAAALTPGCTTIINAALEPEVFDLVAVVRAMGINVTFEIPGMIHIEGQKKAQPIDYAIMYDRLEAGTYLLAGAITKGTIDIPQAPVKHMTVFLELLRGMGHTIICGTHEGVSLRAHHNPTAVSFRTMPYPGFPTDLQAPMLVAQALAAGTSIIHETVYESRFGYVKELQRLGLQVVLQSDMVAIVQGGAMLYGAPMVAGDIRAAAALTLAGLAAQEKSAIFGVEHILRGYVNFVEKLQKLGAPIMMNLPYSSL
jgi:UDP-N-acetylglucosamine 1-carboxyvinyltransferase